MKNDLNKLLPLLLKYKGLLVLVAVLAICGYTAYQISVVVAVAPDAKTISEEQANITTTKIKFDTKTIDAIVHQNQVNVSTDLSGLGTTNPFFGN